MSRFFTGEVIGRHAEAGGECECADMLIAGAYGGWYCPKHGFTDFPPPPYVVDAVRKLNDRVLELANWKHEHEKANAAHGVIPSDEAQGENRG